MASLKPPRLGDLPHAVRDELENLPSRWRDLREGLRNDPGAIFNHPLARITLFVILGIVALLLINWLISGLTPGGTTPTSEVATPWASVYVACTNPECGAVYQAQVARDFKDWPLPCERCKTGKVYRAAYCKECRSWYPLVPGKAHVCQAKEAPVQAPTTPKQRGTDNDEDPW